MKRFVPTLVVATMLLSAQVRAEDRPIKPEREAKEQPEHFRLGPIAGLGFPRPFAIEAFAKFERTVGVGLEYSFMPRTTIASASTRFDAIAVDGRWFPFKGSFFLGVRGGRQWLTGSMTLSVQNVGSFTESAEAATWFVNPRVGFLFTWDSGITLGIDAGVQLPVGATFERSGPATSAGLADNAQTNQTLRTIANTLGNSVTPTLDLFRLGFLF